MSFPLPAFTRSVGDVLAEILMTRAAFLGAIVLVEGPSDSRFISRHLGPGMAQLVISDGKSTLVGAITGIGGLNVSGCVGIIDLDFDHRQGKQAIPNTVYTDTHDIETLLMSKRLKTVLKELAEDGKMVAFELAQGCSAADGILQRSAIFSQLRFLNDVAPAFGVGMTAFKPWKYIDVATWEVNSTQLHADFASACVTSSAQIQTLILGLPNLQTWKDVQGHDALAVLSIGLRRVLGNGVQVSEHSLCSALRLAFSEDDFRATSLYAGLAAWSIATGGLSLFN